MAYSENSPASWFFTAVTIDGTDHLFIIPEKSRALVEQRYGVRIEPDKVRHMDAILQGRNDFEAGNEFRQMLRNMSSPYGEGWHNVYVAREAETFIFSLTSKDDKDAVISSHRKSAGLKGIREAFALGRDATFTMGTAAFTFNAGSDLVSYAERACGQTVALSNFDRSERIRMTEDVHGQFSRASGLAEGKWTRDLNTIPDGSRMMPPEYLRATFKNGRAVEGTLSEGHAVYRPAALGVKLG